ncbi:ras association domain-containing protein 4 isoform X4 [Vombatus ursinus]|uniref:ras association domain-containing protein 4 isoform X4 n=1 Tax=Vombatus ursinus TaxID=29139 RepID=UPI000FFCFEA5|nr:ras association domain-containing protein 4 isoform X4 [Vombatus ursinus]
MDEDLLPNSHVLISGSKSILKSELLSLLKTYNCYHEGRSFQLRHREEEGELIIEGLLNISWGLRRPIRLQMQDDNERIHLSSAPWKKDLPTISQKGLPQGARETIEQSSPHAVVNSESSGADSTDSINGEEETPQLMRTKSDASCMIQRRSKCRTPGEAQKIKRHRFSINGHFYNHKVENGPSEFALYVVHESGERTKLKDCEYPLISRILHGPCEKIAKIFLMETDLGEEVPYDVAQYIKFEMPVLDSFVEKLKEEEEREIIKLTLKFHTLRLMMLQRLEQLTEPEELA